jgi:hypothetical protein
VASAARWHSLAPLLPLSEGDSMIQINWKIAVPFVLSLLLWRVIYIWVDHIVRWQ